MNLPLYIIDKILQYNIHPIAQLIKPLFDCEFYDDYLNESFYIASLNHFFRAYCYFGCHTCHKILYYPENGKIRRTVVYRRFEKNFCKVCYYKYCF